MPGIIFARCFATDRAKLHRSLSVVNAYGAQGSSPPILACDTVEKGDSQRRNRFCRSPLSRSQPFPVFAHVSARFPCLPFPYKQYFEFRCIPIQKSSSAAVHSLSIARPWPHTPVLPHSLHQQRHILTVRSILKQWRTLIWSCTSDNVRHRKTSITLEGGSASTLLPTWATSSRYADRNGLLVERGHCCFMRIHTGDTGASAVVVGVCPSKLQGSAALRHKRNGPRKAR